MVPLFLTIDETNCKAVDNPFGIKEGTHAFGTDPVENGAPYGSTIEHII